MTAACNRQLTNTEDNITDNINMFEISMKSSPSSPPNANHVSKPMEPFCWRIPLVASLLLMILLGSAALLSNRDIHSLGVVASHSSHDAIKDSFPLHTRESGGMTNVMEHSLKIWTGSVIKTVLIEVGAMALFQSVGMLPTLTKILMAGRKVKPAWIRLLTKNSVVVRQMSTGGLRSPPRLVRRLGQFVQTVYKRRSRLSTASDFLNIVGDDDDEEKTVVDIAP